ncbi:chromosome segregation protein SMC [Xylocopilactobacillus apis]|uniref:Chromosome partition protein Smc n=1 Tax=Xylocopilactobacillus apis TaxID=2932183 RepID=A0AAU9DKS1_9LACO|nr:chromosome segregation protein SMC [Xylocopilactobacillus apis]BDR56104.1 chromosome partition protein Smc [Xylocopilactobacillus apis]
MYLKSLTLTGFKSFQKKTTIDFDPQINGVIGPNGSGKSNLIEAIRFAMGEQSGKSLRGNTMKDIIFSGSETESALNRAKVQIVLDNSDHLLSEFGDLVEVGRTLYRDGTSDYQINKQNVRQKDVQNLFLSAGLGRDTMAFINQGKVQSIIDSDPVSRRGVFEEVAGVYKYKLNRREAVSNLDATDFEVQRLKDLLFELNNNLKPLEVESKRATEYSNLKELYDRIHLFSIVKKIDQLVSKREQKEVQQKLLNEDLISKDQQIQSSKQQLQKYTEQSNQQQIEQDALQQKLVQIIKERDDTSSEHQVLLTKKDQHENQIKELDERIIVLRKEAKQITSEQESTTQNIQKITDELVLKEKEQSAFVENSGASLEELNHQLDELKEQYFDLLNKKTGLRNELNVLESAQTAGNNLIASYQKRIDEKSETLTELDQQLEAINKEIQLNQTAIENNRKKIDELTSQRTEIQAMRSKLEHEIALNNNKKQLLSGQIRDLKNQERAMNGFFEGVKAVIQNSEQIGGIVGTIFQLVTVPVKYQKALSEALGTRFQNIVTSDEVSAKRAISYLKKANKGRATFYPQDRIQEQTVSDSLKDQLAQVPGFLGIAIDLISFDEKYRNVISNFFGKLIIAENLDEATKIAHLTQSRYRIVTLDGDLINIGGSMTGGKSSTRNDYFRQTEIDEKAKLLTEVESNISKNEVEDKKLISKSQEIEKLLNQCRLEVESLRKETEEQNRLQAQINAKRNSVNEQIEELKLEISEQEKHQQSAEKIEELKGQLKENSETTTKLDQEMASINEQVDKRLREDESGKRSELESALATLRERKLNLKQRQKDFDTQLKKNQTEQKTTQDRIENLKNDLKNLIVEIKESSDKLKQSNDREQKLNDEKKALIEKSQEITSKHSELDRKLELQQKERSDVAEKLNDLTVQLTRFKVQLDSLLDDLSNEYEMTFEGAKHFVDENELTDEELKSDPQKLQKKLRDFGNVNLDAVNEYQKLKERVDFSEKQLNDVLQARVELQESIDKLDDRVRDLFKEAFDAVNEAFQEIYPTMFSGGTAELKLTDPDDLLKTGVEIVAAPPGKKTRSLSLLSGGEKSLSAITLLFAIINVSTVPFSILDEVEAALDDANVDRFSQYLERFNGKTQFIIITHRRSTMRSAQRLFGVTMVGTGISKMVSVKLDDELTNEE